MSLLIAFAVLVLTVVGARAGAAGVEAVKPTQNADGTWRFAVTVLHADEGWDHYANAFVVLTEEGTVLGTRTLAHPHVDEQPFTRTLNHVEIPEEIDVVYVRAVDSVHGDGPVVRVPLSR